MIDKKKKYIIGITHAGRFHTDDVLSTAFLLSLYPGMRIEREAEYRNDVTSQGTIVYDIGGGRYDHHKTKKEINKYGYPYSAFGLLWRDLADDYLRNNGFNNIEAAKKLFEERYVSKVDQGDNCGYQGVKGFWENDLIINFNPLWYEEERSDERFFNAVEFAGFLLKNWTRKLYQEVEMSSMEDEIWKKSKEKAKNGIFIFDRGIPWKTVAQRHPEDKIQIAIGRSNRNGYYIMPAEGSGIIIPEDENLMFRHSSGYMGIADELPKAVLVAKHALTASGVGISRTT